MAKAIGAVASRYAAAQGSPEVSFATVVDPRPGSLTIKVAGGSSGVEAIASDFFSLFGLDTGDVVVALRVAGGPWAIAFRVFGSEPEYEIDPADIAGSLISAGPGITREGEDTESQIQWYRPAATTSFTGNATATVVWTFEEPFALPPKVVANIEGLTSAATDLFATVGPVTKSQATIYVRSYSASAISARLVAMAHGAV